MYLSHGYEVVSVKVIPKHIFRRLAREARGERGVRGQGRGRVGSTLKSYNENERETTEYYLSFCKNFLTN